MCKKATIGLERPEERVLSVKKLLVKNTRVKKIPGGETPYLQRESTTPPPPPRLFTRGTFVHYIVGNHVWGEGMSESFCRL